MRIDKLLWFLRFAHSRTLAQDMIASGHLRLNGNRILRASTTTKVGDVIVLPGRNEACVIELLALPTRRGPAVEAHACYRLLELPSDTLLDELAPNPIAAGNRTASEGTRTP